MSENTAVDKSDQAEERTRETRSFAAGRRAKAIHDGAFVWADSEDADFESSRPDQFIIRASGE